MIFCRIKFTRTIPLSWNYPSVLELSLYHGIVSLSWNYPAILELSHYPDIKGDHLLIKSLFPLHREFFPEKQIFGATIGMSIPKYRHVPVKVWLLL